MSTDTSAQTPGDDGVGDGLIDAADVPRADLPDVDTSGAAADPGAEAASAVAAETTTDADGVDVAAERRALLELLIYAWDRARSPGVWERLTVGLSAIGVTVERPDGERFDAARHEVGGVQRTEDEALLDTVAETEVVGFTDRGSVLREPVVVVYRRE